MSSTKGLWTVGLLATAIGPLATLTAAEPRQPNMVIVLADDMGWRDTGYNGNKVVKTPHLDDLAAKGLRFDYFYPGGQMCSPGRYALLTGRTPFRAGICHLQPIRPQEIILARALKQAGYRSAHFGKWHLGSGPTSPIGMGFDQATWKGNFFDLNAVLHVNNSKETVQLKGDGSVAVVELALEYIRKQAKEPQPFFITVCFGSPHVPHQAAPEFKALYKDLPPGKMGKDRADFLGEISGLDAAFGKLRQGLRELGIADNTLLWFTSDNGGITQESLDPSGRRKMTISPRIPSLVEWPARITKPMQTSMPCGHVDIYPTLLELAGVKVEKQPVLDGISLAPVLDGKMRERPKPMGFLLGGGARDNPLAGKDIVKDLQGIWIDGKYKLVVTPENKKGGGKSDYDLGLFDIFADPAEKTNLAAKEPQVVARMRQALDNWRQSVRASYDGKDFAKP